MLSGAVVILFVNVTVGLLFTSAYLIVGFAYRGQRRALCFAASYLLGNVAPAADLLASFLGHSNALDWFGYVCFLIGLDSMALSFAYFHHRPLPWKAFFAVLLSGIVMRSLVPFWPHNSLRYGFGYQIPLTIACVSGTVAVLRIAERRFLYLLLASVFSLTAAHFLFKPFLLVRYGGNSLAAYTKTVYALLSQASTGICLFACAIVLLMLVANKALTDSQRLSEIDALSGLLNRRGFDRHAAAILEEAVHDAATICAAIFDIDHFKSINDTHGHAMGDRVITEFATLLQQQMPDNSILGRIGGEEFAVLFLQHDVQSAWTCAENVRTLLPSRLQQHLPVTVSCGITALTPGEKVFQMLQRADKALYRAKHDGRNRVALG